MKEYYTVGEIAAISNLKREVVCDYIRSGMLKATKSKKDKRAYVITKKDFDNFLDDMSYHVDRQFRFNMPIELMEAFVRYNNNPEEIAFIIKAASHYKKQMDELIKMLEEKKKELEEEIAKGIYR